MRIRAGDLVAVEAVHLRHPHALADCLHVARDDVEDLVEAVAERFVEIGRGLEELHPLPAIHDGELRPFGGQNGCQRRGLDGPARRAVFMGEVEAELVLVILDGFQRAKLHVAMPGEAARVEHPGVIAGLTMDDLLRQQPAMPAALAQTRAQANDAERIALARHRTHQRRAVDRVGDGAVHHGLDPHLGQRGHAGEGALQHIGDPVEVVGAEVHGEIGVDPVHPPCLAVLFVEADQKPGLFLTAVIVADRAADQRHPVAGLNDAGDFLGDEILVLHRHDGMMHPHHRAHFVHPVATGVHDDIGMDLALVRFHDPGVVL